MFNVECSNALNIKTHSDIAHCRCFIAVNDVAKSYTVGSTRLTVLRDLSLAVDAGEMVAIVGASGVGKSTLLHVLGGLDSIDGGVDRIGEHDLRDDAPPTSSWRSATGRSASSSSFIICCRSSARSRTRRCRCASRASRRPSATGAPRRCSSASGWASGWRIGPACCRAASSSASRSRARWSCSPAMLLADEPTGDLDEHTADSLHDLLREMHRERGLTSIIATHNPRLAAACDRVLRLEEGQLRPRRHHHDVPQQATARPPTGLKACATSAGVARRLRLTDVARPSGLLYRAVRQRRMAGVCTGEGTSGRMRAPVRPRAMDLAAR